MRKRIISFLMIIIVIVLTFYYSNIDKNSYIYNRNADTSSFYGTGILENGKNITQTFIASEDSIDGINVKVTTSGSKEDVFLYYALLNEDLEQVYVGTISLSQLNNNKFNKLEIPRIVDTRGKQYTIVLGTKNSDAQNGIGVYIEPAVQDKQQLFVNDEETDGTLVARIICRRFDVETFIVSLGMIAFVVVFMKALFKLFK